VHCQHWYGHDIPDPTKCGSIMETSAMVPAGLQPITFTSTNEKSVTPDGKDTHMHL
jgi:hypothetical protein